MAFPTGSFVPSRAELDAAVALGHVARHDFAGLTIYNYTSRCVYERAWTPATLAARGVVYRGEELVALPFPKFFNHNEPDAVIPEGEPTGATVKVDGVLGISYRHQGRIRWTTRGRLDSPPSAVAQRLWDTLHGQVDIPSDWTILAEILSPETKIIVDYEGLECLMVLGARVLDGGYVSREALAAWCEESGVPIVEPVPAPSLQALRDASQKLDPSFEGWVLEWGTHRLKIKGVAYLAIARLIQGMTPRFVGDLWIERVSMDALARVPEETRDWIAVEWARLDALAEATREEALNLQRASAHWREDRRAFVAEVGTKHPLFGLLMEGWFGEEPDWRRYAYRITHGKFPRPTQLG